MSIEHTTKIMTCVNPIILVIGAIFVSWISYRFLKYLKLLDSLKEVKTKWQKYRCASSLACADLNLNPSNSNLNGPRFEKYGGWDEFCDNLNELITSIEILELFASFKIKKLSTEIIENVKDLYEKTRISIVDLKMSKKPTEIENAKSFICNDISNNYKLIEEKINAIIKI